MALTPQVRVRDEVTGAINELGPASLEERIKALPKGGQIITGMWKRTLSGPATRRTLGIGTGALRRSIRSARAGKDARTIGTHLPYAAIHEFGGKTRPHRISPRVGKVLSWMDSSGKRRAARFVNHPGSEIPKRPHREPAVRLARPAIDALFAGALDRAVAIAQRRGKALSRRQKAVAARLGGSARRTGL